MANKKIFVTVLLASALLLGSGVGFWAMRPPLPPSEGQEDYPAFTQMLDNIRIMTREPHPSGSRELEDVRAYLLTQLDKMGVAYEVQETLVTADEIIEEKNRREQANGSNAFVQGNGEQKSNGPPPGLSIQNKEGENQDDPVDDLSNDAVFNEDGTIRLYNILVKLDAENTEDGLLFMAHYDSEFEVPGACDDMTGVCALLETVRRHGSDKNLENDMYFLFTDGEELGGMGAKVFVRDNAALESKLKLVVNLDARGTKGGLIMFETSEGDYEQLSFLQKTSKDILTYSWLPMIYRRMSNGTDLTQFLLGGYTSVNFAVAEGIRYYSSPGDNIDNLHRGTAYDFMQTAFSISDYAAKNPLPKNENENIGVYFTIFPGVTVLMSGLTGVIVAAFAVLAALVLLFLRFRAHRLKPVAAILLGLLCIAAILSAIFVSPAGYLFALPLMCLAITALLPRSWKPFSAAILAFFMALLYMPLCWLLGVLLGVEALPFILIAAAIPVLYIITFFTVTIKNPEHESGKYIGF